MSALSETEIFDCMTTNLQGAIDDCDIIARQPVSGVYFSSLRERLKLVEGCCRQAAYWRDDARWLPLGIMMEECHQRARGWLHYPSVQSKKMFVLLANNLRALMVKVGQLRHEATKRRGAILPVMQHPGTKSNSVLISGLKTTAGGILLPN